MTLSQASFQISVVLCTHNPRPDVFLRVLQALSTQTLAKDAWEFLLIDNNSEPQLDPALAKIAHPGGRVILEKELGLTPSRLRGFREAKSDIAVLVDDDTVLDFDYLEKVLELTHQHPAVAVACGQRRGEFSGKLNPVFQPHIGILAVGEFKKSWWSNYDSAPSRLPVGAGMWVRRPIWEEYAARLDSEPWRKALDRTGNSLTSCGDHDIALTAQSLGWGTGQFAELKLTHVIAPGRTELSYLRRLRQAVSESTALLRYAYFGEIPQLGLWRALKNQITLWQLEKIPRLMMLSHMRGLRDATKKILAMQKSSAKNKSK